MKKIIAVTAASVVFAVLCICFCFAREVDVYGHTFTLDKRSIVFDGDEIDTLQNLISNLKAFPFLKSVDLGSFMVDKNDEESFCRALPGVDLKYRSYVTICGERIVTDSDVLDLSGMKIKDLSEITPYLNNFTNLKKVEFGKNFFPHEDIQKLSAEYPTTEFEAVNIYNVYGKSLKDSAKSVDLRDVEISDDVVDVLSLFKDLKSVDLRGKTLDAETQLKLKEAFPGVTFLWDVDVGGTPYSSTVYELDLSDCSWITDEYIRERLPLFPNLKRLDMSGCDASNEELAKLRDDFPDIEIVWRLTLGQWSLKTDATAFSVLIRDYKHRRITSDECEVFKYCTKLQALDLGHQALTDITFIGEYLPELRVLILADNAVSDLSPLTKCRHLHYLEFFVNYVNDISPLAELRELVDLNISYNYWISDITPLLDLPKLERLWLESTSVSKESVERLREAHPYAKIVNEGEGSVDQGWRSHYRYWSMMDMWYNDYISEAFTEYDEPDQ